MSIRSRRLSPDHHETRGTVTGREYLRTTGYTRKFREQAVWFDEVDRLTLRAKKVKPLAISMNKRSVVLPEVSTMDEAGVKGFEAFGWSAMLAPVGLANIRLE